LSAFEVVDCPEVHADGVDWAEQRVAGAHGGDLVDTVVDVRLASVGKEVQCLEGDDLGADGLLVRSDEEVGDAEEASAVAAEAVGEADDEHGTVAQGGAQVGQSSGRARHEEVPANLLLLLPRQSRRGRARHLQDLRLALPEPVLLSSDLLEELDVRILAQWALRVGDIPVLPRRLGAQVLERRDNLHVAVRPSLGKRYGRHTPRMAL
jgi:hypothetical protein